ncbi:MFS transporter [Haloferula sp. BvORR071]|uniref:MFS transporter n=1 Tax=Haloferula sp. BvORR071 TaxID=1396141 RepID=UPI00054F5070|nr:MFS transporter [Haloferula sp. BvORR071]
MALSEAQQRAVISRVSWNLVPLLFFCYIVAYIDRINVGFAKSHLEPVLGVDPKIFGEVFGTGAGLFFIGYFLFEVPSNLAMQKVGARIWIARIMIVWGLVSMCFMFIHDKTSFYLLRFLLGAAEAGFFPGVILYLTWWFPAKERAKTVALFALGGVAAGMIGSPISGLLLKMDGIANLPGWKWLFLIEAIPAVLMGLVVLFYLPNRPADAKWLSIPERTWLINKIAAEAQQAEVRRMSLKDVFTSPLVWVLCLLYFLVNVAGYGYEFWLPSIVKGKIEPMFAKEHLDLLTGLLNMIPYFVAGVAMILVSRHSDQSGERRKHIAASAFVAAIGFAGAAFLQNPWLALASLVVALAGQKSTLGPFWALGTSQLSGTAAAGGIAFINSVGNLGGYFGPKMVGMIADKDRGSGTIAMLWLGGALLLLSVIAMNLPEAKRKAE